jgi:hypothetical protein
MAEERRGEERRGEAGGSLTSTFVAAEQGHHALVRLLLDADANPDSLGCSKAI